ncbi:unnamed protein product [Schistosoma rodhaini]|nr:unnamed protein product [Schistosoma rodhaini]
MWIDCGHRHVYLTQSAVTSVSCLSDYRLKGIKWSVLSILCQHILYLQSNRKLVKGSRCHRMKYSHFQLL